jgi:hypothetical protein
MEKVMRKGLNGPTDELEMVQQMNWKKGLVRLWIAVSLLWAICTSIYLYSVNLPAVAEPQQQQGQDTIQLAAMIIGPPIAFLALGFGVWWVIAGFEAPKHKKHHINGASPSAAHLPPSGPTAANS